MDLQITGRTYTIPAVPAVDWLVILMADAPDLDRILVDLCPSAAGLLFDESLDPDELYQTLLDVVEQVSGRKWWIAMRLIKVVQDNWNVLGAEMFFKNVDPARLSLSGWLDAMFLLTIRAIEPKEVAAFVMKLEAPPEGEDAAVEDMEMTPEQFLSMA